MKNLLPAYILAVIILGIYLIFTKKLLKNKYYLIILLFLFISPWFMQLFIFGLEPKDFTQINLSPNNFTERLINNSSTDYLFFQGDKRITFGTQETGLLYLFQIPLLFIGFYQVFDKLNSLHKKIIFWLLIAFLISGLFKDSSTSSISLLYLLPLQIISVIGLIVIFKSWLKGNCLIKCLISILLFFALYEIIIYFHILIVHYPKRLLLQ